MEPRSNQEMLRDARRSIEAFAAKVRETEHVPGMRPLTELFLAGHEGPPPEHLRYPYFDPGHPAFEEVIASARDAAIFRLWSRTKIVYAMDERLLEFLTQSSATPIPVAVLQHLPHVNPYVLLPRADPAEEATQHYRTHIGVPQGAFIFGRYDNATRLCSISDARRQDLGIMFAGELDTPDGIHIQTLRCTIPLRERSISVNQAVQATLGRFVFNQDLPEDQRDHLIHWLRRYVAQVFSSVLYVCTDQPDIETYRPGLNRAGKPKRRSKKKQADRLDTIDQVIQLGFRLGPALHRAHHQWQRDQQGTSGSGSRQRPHQRRGHYQTYWTGPGRQVPKLHWVAPYWVNEALLGNTESGQVVVRPVRRRP